MFLTLKSGLEKSAAYRKDDLWVLSTVPELSVPTQSGPGDRLARPFVLMARSCWHGPNNEGRFEVELLCAAPANLRRKQQVFALHGPEASTELAMIFTLQTLSTTKLPIMSALLQPITTDQSATSSPVGDDSTASCQIDGPESRVTSAVLKIIEQFGLNAEQATVLRAMQPWFLPSSKGASPLCIVHGPFGTGKSMLLVAAIHLLLALRDMEGPLKGCRVAAAAHTNAAVDRIMCGLLHSGQTDLLRVGPLRRIDRSLLAYSLHSTAGKRSEAAQELEAMLKEATSVSEQKILRDELAEVRAGAERKRRRKLKTAAVVGVTCCSAALPVLDDQQFDVVFLDECSQMVEPLSLLPLSRAACRFAVLSGDPMQLPPLIAHPSHVTQRPGAPVAHGLSRPVFERLASMGHHVHLLRRQYRCHPEIAAISNAHFYGGRLLDGCSAADRPPLVRGLPPLLCLDVRGSQEYAGGSHSASNRAEASAVVQVVRALLTQQPNSDREGSEQAELAVTPEAIGVICFHKAQVALVASMLSRPSGNAAGVDVSSSSDVTVATVDSYQGLEKPVIILSTAVTRVGAFVADPHRLNVALTRAKHHLILVGDAAVLHDTAPAFKAFIMAARASPGACRQFHPGQPIPLASLLTS
ncbi:Protein ZGRF1 [Coccomyxa sp. Obi]|nr:Protein ZGRF1 [Coccomyxa sp. Obi]